MMKPYVYYLVKITRNDGSHYMNSLIPSEFYLIKTILANKNNFKVTIEKRTIRANNKEDLIVHMCLIDDVYEKAFKEETFRATEA